MDTLEETARKFMYDNFALGSECFRFGITQGYSSSCPVFKRGQCELQEENETRFLGEDND